ncbi:MAG: radical SAM protein, partial [Solobacterium sp.]|nr:radical SAM protein [Solobacterium sp.]
MRFSVVNLGCKVNAYECESVASMLEEAGHVRVSNDEARDATVVFTCAVTNTAAQKSRQQIHRIRRRYPDSILAVAGCYAQIDPQALKDAEILVGSAHKKRIPEYIEQYIRKQEPIMDVEKIEVVPFEDLVLDHLGTHSRVYLKIQDGCNQFCAYCVIPYARGRERSMEPERVEEEARKLCAKYQEIVLTGIHTGRYGREYGVSLAQIMKRIL